VLETGSDIFNYSLPIFIIMTRWCPPFQSNQYVMMPDASPFLRALRLSESFATDNRLRRPPISQHLAPFWLNSIPPVVPAGTECCSISDVEYSATFLGLKPLREQVRASFDREMMLCSMMSFVIHKLLARLY
jgi:hypothetical protein